MKNFIWDFDGTLYNTYLVMMDALMQALEEFNLQLDYHEVYKTIKQESIRHLVQELKLPEGPFNQLFHYYEKRILTESFPYNDTKETLKLLQADGGRHFILTHRTVDSTWHLLKRDLLDNAITDIIGSDSGYPRKPDPTALNALVEQYELSREQTLMIGDRRLDIDAGKNAEVATCFYNQDHLDIKVDATYEIAHLKEIPSLFQ